MKPLKDTKVGKFLASKGFTNVMNIAGSAIPLVGTLNQIKDAVLGDSPEVPLTPEEKQQFIELYEEQMKELDMHLKDVANAREREVRMNESEHASWLSRNVTSILALLIATFFIILNVLVLLGNIKTSDNITFLVMGNVATVSGAVFGYYFGSSRSSSEKDRTIQKLSSQG